MDDNLGTIEEEMENLEISTGEKRCAALAIVWWSLQLVRHKIEPLERDISDDALQS